MLAWPRFACQGGKTHLPVLQAICYSLLDSNAQPKVHAGRGCTPADLEPAVSWASKAFSISTSEDTMKQVHLHFIILRSCYRQQYVMPFPHPCCYAAQATCELVMKGP